MKIAVIDNDIIAVKNVKNIELEGRKGAIVKVLCCGPVSYTHLTLPTTERV